MRSISSTMRAVLFAGLIAWSAWIVGCGTPGPLVKLRPFAYPQFSDDMHYDGLEHAIAYSLEYLRKQPATRLFKFGEDRYPTGHLIRSLETLDTFLKSRPNADRLTAFIRQNYQVYRSAGGASDRKVLFTGYYEPFLNGSLSPGPAYPHAVYARPRDLVTINMNLFLPDITPGKRIGRLAEGTVIPYPERRTLLEQDQLKDRAAVLAYVDDPVDLFFLQIQGSGKIYLNNGAALNVHYHGSNGQPYRSIGKLLIDTGKIPRAQMSMQRIRAYLAAHPQEIDAVFSYNPSYVFFKLEEDGPIGFLNVKLTPGRSLATDRRLFPPAAPAFIETEKPVVDGNGRIEKWVPFTRFVVNQDTGGAIRGPGRADLFWGNGPYAEIAAGHMQHTGKMYFLILKPDS